ncbi:hypothetical protein ACFQ9X_01835 [Catenulispora yoronensis]
MIGDDERVAQRVGGQLVVGEQIITVGIQTCAVGVIDLPDGELIPARSAVTISRSVTASDVKPYE